MVTLLYDHLLPQKGNRLSEPFQWTIKMQDVSLEFIKSMVVITSPQTCRITYQLQVCGYKNHNSFAANDFLYEITSNDTWKNVIPHSGLIKLKQSCNEAYVACTHEKKYIFGVQNGLTVIRLFFLWNAIFSGHIKSMEKEMDTCNQASSAAHRNSGYGTERAKQKKRIPDFLPSLCSSVIKKYWLWSTNWNSW